MKQTNWWLNPIIGLSSTVYESDYHLGSNLWELFETDQMIKRVREKCWPISVLFVLKLVNGHRAGVKQTIKHYWCWGRTPRRQWISGADALASTGWEWLEGAGCRSRLNNHCSFQLPRARALMLVCQTGCLLDQFHWHVVRAEPTLTVRRHVCTLGNDGRICIIYWAILFSPIVHQFHVI